MLLETVKPDIRTPVPIPVGAGFLFLVTSTANEHEGGIHARFSDRVPYCRNP